MTTLQSQRLTKCGAVLSALLLAAASQVHAATLPAVDTGFVTEAGGSAKGDGTVAAGATFNYSVGREVHYGAGALFTPLTAMDRNNYFVFDLSSAPAPIASATLKLYAGTLESVDAIEEFALLAPSDPGAALSDAGFLTASNAIGTTEFDEPTDPAVGVAMAMYGNIAGGAGPLGSLAISSADDDTTLSIPLSLPGVDYLNSFLGGPVILGGTVTTVVPPGTPQQPFGFTGPDIPGGDPLTPVLVVTYVPEPTSLLLLALGGFVLQRWRSNAGS